MPPTFFFYFVSLCFKKNLVNHIFLKFPWSGLFNYFSPSFFHYIVTYVCAYDLFFMFNNPLDPSSCFFSFNCYLILKLLTSVLFIYICLITFRLFSVSKYPFVLTGLCWLDNSAFLKKNQFRRVIFLSVDRWFQPLWSWLLAQPFSEWGTVIPGRVWAFPGLRWQRQPEGDQFPEPPALCAWGVLAPLPHTTPRGSAFLTAWREAGISLALPRSYEDPLPQDTVTFGGPDRGVIWECLGPEGASREPSKDSICWK